MNDRVGKLIEAEELPGDYREVVDAYWRPLADAITLRAQDKRPLIVGINGAQGSGKSTLCRFLEVLLDERGLTAITLSLDDLYLTRAQRRELAHHLHPLFATRGVPGTHEVALGEAIFDDLEDGRDIYRPKFDKASDDRKAILTGPDRNVDILLFEGWCVGAVAQAEEDLALPLNSLESEEDPEGIWRRQVNRRLAGEYAHLFGRIDMLIMLAVSGFEAVGVNRRRQEAKLARHQPDGSALLDDAAMDRFLAHYERLTRHMLAEMPSRADIVIEIDADQRPVDPTNSPGKLVSSNNNPELNDLRKPPL